MKRNRFTFIFLLILSIIFLYNFGGFVPSLFFNILLSVFLFSVVYTIYIYFRLVFKQDMEKDVIVKGEKVRLTVSLSNRDLLIYPFIFVTFRVTHNVLKEYLNSKSFSINPLSRKMYTFEMECKYRGQYEVGISELYIEDFLGIIRLKIKVQEHKKLIVYPKIEHLDYFDVYCTNISDTQNLSQSSIEETNNIKDLRNYNYGDSFRKIHWKLSARNNKLLIKNYQSTSDINLNVILDLRKNMYTAEMNIIIEDKLIEAIIAVLHYYLLKSVHVNYIFFNQKLEVLTVSNQTDFDFIYNTLAAVEFNQTIPLSDILILHNENSNNDSDIIIFTSMIDINLYNELANSISERRSICLIYVSPQNQDIKKSDQTNDIIKNLLQMGVTVYTINPDDEIKNILGGLN